MISTKTLLSSLAIVCMCSCGPTEKSEPAKKAAATPTGAPAAVNSAKPDAKPDHNIYCWRGPLQSGESLEHYKNGMLDETPVWKRETHGRGTPVIVDGRVFTFGYRGSKEELMEHLACVDAATGKQLWEIPIRDFISDTVYNRYSIGSPCVDPETKRVYVLTAYGVFICADFDGKELWRHSLMEEIGRMTFPNSRVGSPLIEGDMVIVQGITANWGSDGPAANRYYAFDKMTGEIVWASTPGEIPPKDSSHSTPVFETRDGKRVFWVGTGCGNVVCVNARTGKPLFRHKVSKGGVNGSVLIHKGSKVIAVHGEENPDSSDKGRLVAVKMPDKFEAEQMIFDPETALDKWKANELWRVNVRAETSSPALAGDHVYLISEGGELYSVNANDGTVEWTKKLTNANIHASPFCADGLVYCSLLEGKLAVVKPGEKDAEIVKEITLQGTGLGSPVIANGQLYVHTAERGDKPGYLYCFKIKNDGITCDPAPVAEMPKPGKPAALQIIPWEFVLHPGEKHAFKIRSIDANGFPTGQVAKASWETFIPPTAKVKAKIEDAKFNDANELVANTDAKAGAGAFKATADGISGTIRGRVLPKPPFSQDFEKLDLGEEHPGDATTDGQPYKFAYPPLPWIGARFKYDVRDITGSKVLAKNLDRLLFQRGIVFIGTADMSNYTVQADIMTDGNRRGKSDIGLINQRYMIVLKGNSNKLEVSSNYERFRREVDFTIKAQQWYTMKTQVKVNADGTGVVLGKVWEKGQPEPEAWTIEAQTDIVHRQGSPGLFGFALQNQHRVYFDNISVTPNP